MTWSWRTLKAVGSRKKSLSEASRSRRSRRALGGIGGQQVDVVGHRIEPGQGDPAGDLAADQGRIEALGIHPLVPSQGQHDRLDRPAVSQVNRLADAVEEAAEGVGHAVRRHDEVDGGQVDRPVDLSLGDGDRQATGGPDRPQGPAENPDVGHQHHGDRQGGRVLGHRPHEPADRRPAAVPRRAVDAGQPTLAKDHRLARRQGDHPARLDGPTLGRRLDLARRGCRWRHDDHRRRRLDRQGGQHRHGSGVARPIRMRRLTLPGSGLGSGSWWSFIDRPASRKPPRAPIRSLASGGISAARLDSFLGSTPVMCKSRTVPAVPPAEGPAVPIVEIILPTALPGFAIQ